MGDVILPPDIAEEFKSLRRRVDALERTTLRQQWYAEQLGEVSTLSGGAVDLGGPYITLDLQQPCLIAFMLEHELRSGSAWLYESTDVNPAAQISLRGNSTYMLVRSAPSPDLTSQERVGGWGLVYGSPGVRTFKVLYSSSDGVTRGFFRNRRLWLEVLRPIKAAG